MIEYGKTLPMTGAGVSLFGLYFGQLWLVVVAVTLVTVGALLLRFGFRRGKNADRA